MKLNKTSLQKLFDAPISSKSTTGIHYSRRRYRGEKDDIILTVVKRKYHRSKEVSYYLQIEKITDVKVGTPEYKKLLWKHGSLHISGRNTAILTVFAKRYEDEQELLNDLEKEVSS